MKTFEFRNDKVMIRKGVSDINEEWNRVSSEYDAGSKVKVSVLGFNESRSLRDSDNKEEKAEWPYTIELGSVEKDKGTGIAKAKRLYFGSLSNLLAISSNPEKIVNKKEGKVSELNIDGKEVTVQGDTLEW